MIFGSDRVSSESEGSQSSLKEISAKEMREGQLKTKKRVWNRPVNTEVKMIDFGGATYQSEHHTQIINTRQYRAPEVILGRLTCTQF